MALMQLYGRKNSQYIKIYGETGCSVCIDMQVADTVNTLYCVGVFSLMLRWKLLKNIWPFGMLWLSVMHGRSVYVHGTPSVSAARVILILFSSTWISFLHCVSRRWTRKFGDTSVKKFFAPLGIE